MEQLAEMERLRRLAVRLEMRSRSEPVSIRMRTGDPLISSCTSRGFVILDKVAQVGLRSVN
jgi:hypothetical protein